MNDPNQSNNFLFWPARFQCWRCKNTNNRLVECSPPSKANNGQQQCITSCSITRQIGPPSKTNEIDQQLASEGTRKNKADLFSDSLCQCSCHLQNQLGPKNQQLKEEQKKGQSNRNNNNNAAIDINGCAGKKKALILCEDGGASIERGIGGGNKQMLLANKMMIPNAENEIVYCDLRPQECRLPADQQERQPKREKGSEEIQQEVSVGGRSQTAASGGENETNYKVFAKTISTAYLSNSLQEDEVELFDGQLNGKLKDNHKIDIMTKSNVDNQIFGKSSFID